MIKYKKCNNICDYDNYYVSQASGKYPQNLVIQRGSNWFTSFAKRYGIPTLKFLGKQVYETGKDLFHDIVEGKDIKHSTKSNIKKGLSRSLKDLSERMTPQSGTGRKRRRTTSKRRYPKRRKTSNINKSKTKSKSKRRRRQKKVKKDIFN